jgi:hypothetical protein
VQGKRFESPSGPATLGTTAKAGLLLRTWCRDCRHAVAVDPGGQAERYGDNLPVPDGLGHPPFLPQTPRLDQVIIKPTTIVGPMPLFSSGGDTIAGSRFGPH